MLEMLNGKENLNNKIMTEYTYTYNEDDYTVPRVTVTNNILSSSTNKTKGGVVGLIGAFPSDKSEILSFNSLSDLRTAYGIMPGQDSETQFNGARAAKRIFMEGVSEGKGAYEIRVCNITTKPEDIPDGINVQVGSAEEGGVITLAEDEVIDPSEGTADELLNYDTRLTPEKLKTALSKIQSEQIDMLFVADAIGKFVPPVDTSGIDNYNAAQYKEDNDRLGILRKALVNLFENQKPVPLVFPLKTTVDGNGSSGTFPVGSSTINVVDATVISDTYFKDQMPLLLHATTGRLKLNGSEVVSDLIESSAHICGFIAGTNIQESLTRKEIPGVTGVEEELYFGVNDAGYKLTQKGLHVIVPKSERDGKYCIKNSRIPFAQEYDVSHVRCLCYLIKSYGLSDKLGRINSTFELETLKTELKSVNKTVMDELGIFQDINCEDIESLDANRIKINLKVVMDGILLKIDLGVEARVE